MSDLTNFLAVAKAHPQVNRGWAREIPSRPQYLRNFANWVNDNGMRQMVLGGAANWADKVYWDQKPTALDNVMASLDVSGIAPAKVAAPVVAGTAGLLGLMAKKAPSGAYKWGKQAGIIGGKEAKTADLVALQRAQELQQAGKGADDIYADTKWWLDHPDGQPRFEIDDSGAALRQDGLNAFHNESELVRQWKFMDHNELLDAYPAAGSITYRKHASPGASYGEGTATIRLPQDAGHPDLFPEMREVGTKSPALHELQHDVQGREGFARGGNPDRMGMSELQQFAAAEKAYNASRGDAKLLAELGVDIGAAKKKKPWNKLTRREQVEWLAEGRNAEYRKLAGETEARLVQDRMNMTMPERHANPFYKNYDVPLDQQIVRKDGLLSQSVAPKGLLGDTQTKAEKIAALRAEANAQRFGGDYADYAGSHRPSDLDGGAAQLHDLTVALPDDIYGPNAVQYYGSNLAGEENMLDIFRAVRGKPDEMVTIYRGVPDGVDKINKGDWISLAPEYAAEYGEVISKQVPAKDITAWGDSLVEFGYYPSK